MRLNSIPKEEYWRDPEWSAYLNGIGLDRSYNRRHWEWAQVAYGLDWLGALHEKSRGLGIGVGKEPLIFYLATRCAEIVATDMYESTWAKDGQANPSMLTEPEKFSSLPFPKNRLRVMRMDARKLAFPECSFDFTWSVGAIEHIGMSRPKAALWLICRLLGLGGWASSFTHHGAVRAVREMHRILKPGGIAAITTECILNGRPHHEFFLPQELERFIIEPSGMKLVGQGVDISPSPYLSENVQPQEKWYSGETPHVILRTKQGLEFTSVSLFLRKAS